MNFEKLKTASFAAAVAAAFALLLGSPAAAQSRTVDETRTVDANVRIEIENVAGEVTIRGWAGNEVRIQGTLEKDVEDLIIEGSGSSLLIEVEIPDRTHGRAEIAADLEIHVPFGARLQVETVSAGIDVRGVDGDMELESVSGSVEVEGSPGEVAAESVSGSIRIRGEGTEIRAESVSGSIEVKGAAGRVDASSVSGNVEVRADRKSKRLDSSH